MGQQRTRIQPISHYIDWFAIIRWADLSFAIYQSISVIGGLVPPFTCLLLYRCVPLSACLCACLFPVRLSGSTLSKYFGVEHTWGDSWDISGNLSTLMFLVSKMERSYYADRIIFAAILYTTPYFEKVVAWEKFVIFKIS